MRPIPKPLLNEMLADPFYKICCVSGISNERIELHHNFIFGGRQVNEAWCILPLAHSIHERIIAYKDRCDQIMLNRADEATLKKYSKAIDLIRKRDYLNKKFK
jgi:hypothetical protein